MSTQTMTAEYLESIFGVSFEKLGEHGFRIRSVDIAGYVDFWPTTGKFKFSNSKDCENLEFSGEAISLSELVNKIRK